MIILLAVIFFALFIMIGGERGAISMIALIGNIAVFIISIVAMSLGFPSIIVTIIACVFVNSITLIYQNGKNRKTKAAVLSVITVLLLLFPFAFWITRRMHIGGLNEITLLSDLKIYYSFNIKINMEMVCICMVIIGVLGAIMDTAVAVSSALFEVHRNNKNLTDKELFHSGISIGKDILGTTLNTLYFAYIGEALMLMLYMKKYNYSFMSFVNSEAFLQDFTCIVISAAGCMLIIPLSAFITEKIIKHDVDSPL